MAPVRGAMAQHENELVAAGATVQKLAGGFAFTEGPAADAIGNVYFSDIPHNRIHRWSIDGELTTFRQDSGGANGLAFDEDGNLLACEGSRRRLTSISPQGTIAVLADQYDGKKLNSPNDLWIDPHGGVYFTDPRYGNQEGLEQDGFHVYYLARSAQQLQRVIDDLVKPNGIIGTADGKSLYVADAGAGKTYVFRINSDGTLADRSLFCESGSDGMTLDERGNLYLTTDSVDLYAPDGTKIASYQIPETPANVTFGGADGRTLFITARSGLYALRMNVKGDR
jgi:gluconolactonase